MTTPQQPAPEKRVQSSEDAIARMTGQPRSHDEAEADRQALEEERIAQAQRVGGTAPAPAPTTPAEPKPATSTRSTSSKDTSSST